MNRFFVLLLSALCAGTAVTLPAQTYTEGSDAGDRRATATAVPTGTTVIEGTLAPGTGSPFGANPVDVDVYAFFLPVATDVEIEAASEECDVNLLLLDRNFRGIVANDDRSPRDPDATIQISLLPGLYHLAIGQNNTSAFPAGANGPEDAVWDNDSGFLASAEAAVPIAFLGADDEIPAPTDGESYEITFNFTAGSSGLDLSVGKRPNRFLGVGFLSHDGSGQTVKVKGAISAIHYLQARNVGFSKTVTARLRGIPGSVPVEVMELGVKKRNVTAAFLTGRYRRPMAAEESLRYSVMITALTRVPSGPPSRTPTPPITRPLDRLVLTTMEDAADSSITDTVGAKVRIR